LNQFSIFGKAPESAPIPQWASRQQAFPPNDQSKDLTHRVAAGVAADREDSTSG
jgi:hypothetical protein